VTVVDEDGFDLALVLRGVAASDDEASVTRAGRGETSVPVASDEASKVRAGETSEPAEATKRLRCLRCLRCLKAAAKTWRQKLAKDLLKTPECSRNWQRFG